MRLKSVPEQGPIFSPHRKAVLRALLIFIAGSTAIFVVFNIHNGNIPLAVAEAAICIYSLVLLVVTHRITDVSFWIYAYLLPFYTVILFALTLPLTSPSVFVWMLMFPVLSHLLLGRWVGGTIALSYMLAAACIFLWRYGFPDFDGELGVVLNIVLCGVCIFAFSHIHETSRASAEQALHTLATADPLTGLANRASFREKFDCELSRHDRHQVLFCLLILDLDHFKEVNDQFGHSVGDVVLKTVASAVQAVLRPSDMMGRIGGEEFGVILTSTRLADARTKAEMIRRELAQQTIRDKNEDIAVTVSIGIAVSGADGEDFASIFSAADKRLYQAKAQGRNCVVA